MAEVVSRLSDELRKEMLEAEAQVVHWSTEQKQVADQVALHAQRMLETDKENQDQLTSEMAALSTATDKMQQHAQEEQLQLRETQKDLERLVAVESKLPAERQHLESMFAHQRQLVVQREEGRQRSIEAKEQKLAELNKGCSLYSRRLGLTFERVGDEKLRLIFTQIDARDPERQFSFQVFVDAQDHYHVLECVPPVAGMGELLQVLNSSNDFSTFVRAVRKKFRELVQ